VGSITATASAPVGAIREALRPGSPPNRLLRLALAVPVVLLTLYMATILAEIEDLGNDFAIPLAAADRWIAGERVYDPAAFGRITGPDMPYLYPPMVLPPFALLSVLPREVVLWLGRVICLVSALFVCHRLRVPGWWWPFVLLARPFSEAILAANVQVVLAALFVALFFRRGEGRADAAPIHSDPADPSRPAVPIGLLAIAVPAIKPTQVQGFAYVAFRRPAAALAGLAAVAAYAVATLPLTGIDLWFEWFAYLGLARANGGPAGLAPVTYVGPAVALALTAASILAVAFVPRREAGTWVGVLSVVGALSLHAHGFLYLFPAWLLIRREVALVAAWFAASLWDRGVWTAALIVIVAFVLSHRWPALREPVAARPGTGTMGPSPAEVAAG
jgi:hypothetical protein